MQRFPDTPKHDPNCCLSLSTRLFEVIRETAVQHVQLDLAQDTLSFLSIGCGTGLFENRLSTYLQQDCLLNARVEGVETQSATIPFLSNELVYRVKGTWDVLDDIYGVHVLLFVYPREGRLVLQYLEKFYDNCTIAIWLGPHADWMEQEQILQNTTRFGRPYLLENAGLVAYETAMVFESLACKREGSMKSAQPFERLD